MAFGVDLTGSILDRRYRITGVIGKGGMGHVYEAVHIALDQRVAIKVLHPRYADEERYRDRFLQEARAVSKIRHPNVVEIKDFGETPHGSVYFVMEYLRGKDLGAVLQQHRALPWARARQILLQAAGALGAAHAKRIIHRDIKPGNCFLVEDEAEGLVDVVKLLDFGIAKVGGDSRADAHGKGLTDTGEVFGTASYMAPEQALSRPLDARSDVYSLGIMAYEMLVGRVPFTGGNPIEVITQHVRDPPVPPRKHDPKIPAVVEALVLEMIAKAPGDRPESMAAVERALRGIAADAGVKRTRLGGSVAPSTTTARTAAGSIDAGTDTEVDATVVARGGRGKVVPVSERGESGDDGPATAPRTRGRAGRGATMVAPRAPAVGRVEPAKDVEAPTTEGAGAPAETSGRPEARRTVATAPAMAASPTTVESPASSSSGLLARPDPVTPAWGSGGATSEASMPPAAPFVAGWKPGARGGPARAEASAWSHGSASAGALGLGHGDGSAPSWLQSTSSTGPHGGMGDAIHETRPHFVEPVGMLGGPRRLVLAGVFLVLLVGGGSAAVTMAVLGTDASAGVGDVDGAAPEEVREPARAESSGKDRGVTDDAARREVEPVVLADVRAEPSIEERTGEALAGEEGGDPSSAVEDESTKQAPKPHETKACTRVRKRASAAYDGRRWNEVIETTKQTRCWAPDQRSEPQYWYVRALAETGHFEECVATGRSSDEPRIVSTVKKCRGKQ